MDVAVAFLPVLSEMRQYCSFSTALDETRLTAVMKRPQESATGSGLLAPFERTVWLLVLASLIFVGPIIYLFANTRFLKNLLFQNFLYISIGLENCLNFLDVFYILYFII